MSAWLVALAIAALCLQTGLRSRAETRAWLGADPLRLRRPLRLLCLAAVGALLTGAWLGAAREPPLLLGAGADVVLVVDVSRSMGARDVAPTRLRRALRTARDVVEQADGVRLGLVAFAGDAFAALPLTQDRDALLTYLRALDTDTLSVPGSDLARGLEVAAEVFDPRSSRPRQVLLLSDGEHLGSDLESRLAALHGAGIRVVAVGYGSTEGARIPERAGAPLRDRRGRVVVTRRNDALLRSVAEATGGLYRRDSEDRPAPAELLPPPGALPRSETADSGDLLAVLLILAAAALAAELLLSGAPRAPRRSPLAAALAASALGLLGLASADWIDEGDARLEAGVPQEALVHYRKAERAAGETSATRIRVGNAHYRLERYDQAAGAYVDALRRLRPGDGAARFTASFNLGDTLLSRGRYLEARDAFWAALLERPDDMEAKFNYEWAGERVPPPLPTPPAQSPPEPQDSEAAPTGDGSAPSGERAPETQRDLDPDEAERWLSSLREPVNETLARQIAAELRQRRTSGPTW